MNFHIVIPADVAVLLALRRLVKRKKFFLLRSIVKSCWGYVVYVVSCEGARERCQSRVSVVSCVSEFPFFGERKKTPTMSMKTQFSFLPCHRRCFGTETDEQNIPMKTTTAIAGRNLSISCPGVNEHSLIDTLTWKTSTHKIIAKYINNNEQKPMVQNERVSCLLFFLIFVQNQHNFAD